MRLRLLLRAKGMSIRRVHIYSHPSKHTYDMKGSHEYDEPWCWCRGCCWWCTAAKFAVYLHVLKPPMAQTNSHTHTHKWWHMRADVQLLLYFSLPPRHTSHIFQHQKPEIIEANTPNDRKKVSPQKTHSKNRSSRCRCFISSVTAGGSPHDQEKSTRSFHPGYIFIHFFESSHFPVTIWLWICSSSDASTRRERQPKIAFPVCDATRNLISFPFGKKEYTLYVACFVCYCPVCIVCEEA